MPRARPLARRRSLPGFALAPLLALLAIAVLPLATPAALGQGAVQLTGQVTDTAGVIDGGRATLDTALSDLLSRHGVKLYVAFIPTTGGAAAPAVAQETFQRAGLGGDDFLLLVAVNDRLYGWWSPGVTQISSDQLNQMLSQTLTSAFQAGNYAGGVAAFADALGSALSGGSSGGAPGGNPSPSPGGGLDVGLIVAILLVVAGVTAVLLWARARLLAHRSAEERDRRTGQLAREANAGLVRIDDAVRDAQQELGFAEAEFDQADVAPMRAAIGEAQAELKAAFTVRQQLDDEVPEDPDTRLRMLGEIVERCRKADAVLAEQHRRLQALRDLERTAPAVLAALPDQVAAVQARLPAAEATIGRLQAYAAGSWLSVKGNVEEARKSLAAVGPELERGRAALAATPPDTRTAAAAARRCQTATAGAAALLDAVDRLAASLDDARKRLDGELKEADADLAGARAAIRPGTDPAIGAGLDEAASLLAGARAAAAAAAPDVLAALRDAQRAHAAADGALAGIRAADEQRAREQAALQAALRAAEAHVARASDYIQTRRHGVGREARTRLAEAQRHLDAAHAAAASDPATAASEAALADRLAGEAYDLARDDFDDWDSGGGRRRGQGDMAGAILGGLILGGMLGGLGRGGGGWGGSPWGMPGGGRGGGGGWGGGGGGRGGGGGW